MTDKRPDSSDFPERPDHPDYWRLAAIVQGLDMAADAPAVPRDQVLPHEVAKHIDKDSVIYVAMMRSLRAHSGHQGIETVKGAGLWLDGFIAGARFAGGGHDDGR